MGFNSEFKGLNQNLNNIIIICLFLWLCSHFASFKSFQFYLCGNNCKIRNIFCLSREISVSVVTNLPAEQPRNRGPIPGTGKTTFSCPKQLECEPNHLSSLLPTLKMNGAIPTLPYISWYRNGNKFYLQLNQNLNNTGCPTRYRTRHFFNNLPLMRILQRNLKWTYLIV